MKLYDDFDGFEDESLDEFDAQILEMEKTSERLREQRGPARPQENRYRERPQESRAREERYPERPRAERYPERRTTPAGRIAEPDDGFDDDFDDGLADGIGDGFSGNDAKPAGKKKRSLAVRITKNVAVSLGLLVLVVVVLVVLLGIYLLGGMSTMFAGDDVKRADHLLTVYREEFFDSVEPPAEPGENEAVVLPEIILPEDLESVATPDVINIILVGTDERSSEYSEDSRGDSITIVSVDTVNGTLKLASVRREMPIPTVARVEHPNADILTHYYQYYREEGVKQLFETYLGIHIDYYVRVNFVAFSKIVDRMGGVDVTLSWKEANYMNTQKLVKISPVKTGDQHLDGNQALIYARIRKIDDNRERVRRQRTVLAQLAAKGSDLSIADLNDIYNSVIDAVQTDIPNSVILKLLTYAPTVLKTDLKSESNYISIPVDKFNLGDYRGNSKVLKTLFYGE